MKKIRPLDFVIVAAIIFFAVISIKKSVSQNGNKVLVHANNDTYEYSLEKDGIYKVQGEIGVTTFEIKDGKVRIIDSCCPNKTCVDQGWTSPIVCLPNRVIITIEDYGEFDAVSE